MSETEPTQIDGIADGVGAEFHAEIAVDPRSTTRQVDVPANSDAAEQLARSDRWVDLVCHRFGVDPDTFDDKLVLRAGKKSVDLTNRDLKPPQKPVPDSLGMKFLHTTMAFPKLTTQAAMLLGDEATRNLVELNREQVDDYVHRREFSVPVDQATSCTGTGYVMVAHGGHVLGIGFFRPADDSQTSIDGGGIIQAMYPKSAALPDDASAFDGPE